MRELQLYLMVLDPAAEDQEEERSLWPRACVVQRSRSDEDISGPLTSESGTEEEGGV